MFARPGEGEPAALAEAYATLRETPGTQREHPTALLAVRAAGCGHLPAALDLIARLPEDDFNGRASHAFRALWITVTGRRGAVVRVRTGYEPALSGR
ncbi:hypothetical protein [Nonomuraea rubra]|uniref:hypothetical protein n=1 Tax=Nonomuraea rubra TaxID=46180 RepID=UPI0031E8C960